MCDDMIEVNLNEEEYERFHDLKEKMRAAKTQAELDFYYSQIKIIIREATERDKS